jgi:hypothetical protein
MSARQPSKRVKSRAALDVLDTFARRYHECEHGASGYPLATCPSGVCKKLAAALATISRTLTDAHDRERYLWGELAHADVALAEAPVGNAEAVPVKAAEATAAYRSAARALFIRGHGDSDTMITALDLIEGELVRTIDFCIRAVDTLARQSNGPVASH